MFFVTCDRLEVPTVASIVLWGAVPSVGGGGLREKEMGTSLRSWWVHLPYHEETLVYMNHSHQL